MAITALAFGGSGGYAVRVGIRSAEARPNFSLYMAMTYYIIGGELGGFETRECRVLKVLKAESNADSTWEGSHLLAEVTPPIPEGVYLNAPTEISRVVLSFWKQDASALVDHEFTPTAAMPGLQCTMCIVPETDIEGDRFSLKNGVNLDKIFLWLTREIAEKMRSRGQRPRNT